MERQQLPQGILSALTWPICIFWIQGYSESADNIGKILNTAPIDIQSLKQEGGTFIVYETDERPDAICKYCGQERWLDMSGETLFFWCVAGCPTEELTDEKSKGKAGSDPEFLTNLGFPLDLL